MENPEYVFVFCFFSEVRMDSGGFCIRYGEMPGPRGVYKICLQSEKKKKCYHSSFYTDGFLSRVSCLYRSFNSSKWKVFSACYQRTDSWKWTLFFFFAFLPPKNINRQQWERKDWKKGIMANPLSRAKSRSSNIRPKILMTASRLFFYKKKIFTRVMLVTAKLLSRVLWCVTFTCEY